MDEPYVVISLGRKTLGQCEARWESECTERTQKSELSWSNGKEKKATHQTKSIYFDTHTVDRNRKPFSPFKTVLVCVPQNPFIIHSLLSFNMKPSAYFQDGLSNTSTSAHKVGFLWTSNTVVYESFVLSKLKVVCVFFLDMLSLFHSNLLFKVNLLEGSSSLDVSRPDLIKHLHCCAG